MLELLMQILVLAYIPVEIGAMVITGKPLINKILLLDRNSMNKCPRCDTLYRQYQIKIYNVRNDDVRDRCPHCGEIPTLYSHRGASTKVKKEKWMDDVPDCPKVSFLGYFEKKKEYERGYAKFKKDEYENKMMYKISIGETSEWHDSMNGGKENEE